MIIDRQRRYLLATPSKCGTTSVERMAKANPSVFTVVRPYQHRMLVPEEFADQHRYMRWLLVRNSYARLVSIWSYLANPANYTQWGADEVQGLTFAEFVAWWLGNRHDLLDTSGWGELKWWRSPNLWLITNAECQEALGVPDRRCITVSEVPSLNPEAWGELKHVNASLHRPGSWEDYWSNSLISRVEPLFSMPNDVPPVAPRGKLSRKRWDEIATNR